MPKAPSSAPSVALKISSQPRQELSKAQKQFNALTARIEKLRREVAQGRAQYDQLLQQYRKLISPFDEKYARAQMELAMILDQAALNMKLSKRQRDDFGTCIIDLCDMVSELMDPLPEWEALYERWSDCSYAQQKVEDDFEESDMMESIVESMLGTDVDWDAVRNDPEAAARLMSEVMEKQNAAQEAQASTREGKKTKARQSKAEAKRKAAEELQSKSLRAIYISLAKLLHPDLESDPVLKVEKEELMKKVSAAYEANDLTTLLKMEMEWLQKEADHLAQLPEDKLKIYIEVLKQQVKEQEDEYWSLFLSPNYNEVREYARLKPESATKKMRSKVRALEEALKEMQVSIRPLREPHAQKATKEFVAEYLYAMKERGDFYY